MRSWITKQLWCWCWVHHSVHKPLALPTDTNLFVILSEEHNVLACTGSSPVQWSIPDLDWWSGLMTDLIANTELLAMRIIWSSVANTNMVIKLILEDRGRENEGSVGKNKSYVHPSLACFHKSRKSSRPRWRGKRRLASDLVAAAPCRDHDSGATA